MAVYSICFIPAALAILLNLDEWEYRLPRPYPIFQLVLTLLSILLYVSALVLWLLYQFSEELGGSPGGPMMGTAGTSSPTTCAPKTSAWLWPS